MKTIDKEIIRNAANSLMNEHEFTTSLEVKTKLRLEGYEAYQSDISYCMKLLCNEENWQCTFNGTFNIYQPNYFIDILGLRVGFSPN